MTALPFNPKAQLADLFRLYAERVRGAIRKQRISEEDALDLTQEVFRRVSRFEGTFPSRKDFENWLFGVSTNVVRNFRRDQKAARRQGEEVPLDTLPEEVLGAFARQAGQARAANPEEQAISGERRRLVAGALRELSPQQRQCTLMFYFQQLRYQEIAQVLQLSVETVKGHLKLARKRLLEILGPRAADLGFQASGAEESSS